MVFGAIFKSEKRAFLLALKPFSCRFGKAKLLVRQVSHDTFRVSFFRLICPKIEQLFGGHHTKTIGLSVMLRCLLRATYPGACGSASGFFSPSLRCRLGLLCHVLL